MFIIDSYYDGKREFELVLCKPDETEVAVLSDAYDIMYYGRFPTTDEINFKIPYYINVQGEQRKNPNFDLVKGDYLVKLNEIEDSKVVRTKFFIIQKPTESSTDTDVKEVLAYSREHELNNKQIRDYNLVSRVLYSPLNEKDENGEHLGVMNYVSTLTSWTLDIQSFMSNIDLISKYRAFDVPEQSLLYFLVEEVQRAYDCVFLFDTVNKVISVKTLDQLNINRDLYISEYNYLKSITKEIDHIEVVTRLHLFGKDNLTIGDINPTGTSFIEDYSFYKTEEYMSKELIEALNNYEELIQYHYENKTFENLLEELRQLRVEQDELREELEYLIGGKYEQGALLIRGLKQIQDDKDSAIKKGEDYSHINIEESNKELEILHKQAEIDHAIIDEDMKRRHNFNPSGILSKQNQIEEKIEEIKVFNQMISKENNFTEKQIKELDFYTRERVLMDSNIETVEDLLEEGRKHLKKISQPPVTFTTSVIDFMTAVEGKADRRKLNLGDLVYLSNEKLNIDWEVRLVGFEYSVDRNELSLQFSNRSSFDDPTMQMFDLQKNAITSSTTIDMSKFKWDKSTTNETLLRQIIDRDLDTAKNRVLAGKNQGIIFDKRGGWFFERDDQGNIMPEQLRIINNSIVISDDYFNTAKLAITPQGFINEKIKYKKFKNLKLDNWGEKNE